MVTLSEKLNGARIRLEKAQAGIADAEARTAAAQAATDKIHEQLPGFSCDWDAASGAAQLAKIFNLIDLDSETFRGRGHTRLAQLEYLLRTKQIDAELMWTAEV